MPLEHVSQEVGDVRRGGDCGLVVLGSGSALVLMGWKEGWEGKEGME